MSRSRDINKLMKCSLYVTEGDSATGIYKRGKT